MSNPNIHTVYMSDAPLGVICQTCGRRALVEIGKICGWNGKGNMTPLAQVVARMKCTTCNTKNSHGFAPPSREWAERWDRGEIEETPGLE